MILTRNTDDIDKYCSGHLFALCSVSLGEETVIELLSRRTNLSKKAIIDGSLCFSRLVMAHFFIAAVRLFGRFIFSEKACHHQIDLMPKLFLKKMLYSEEIKS